MTDILTSAVSSCWPKMRIGSKVAWIIYSILYSVMYSIMYDDENLQIFAVSCSDSVICDKCSWKFQQRIGIICEPHASPQVWLFIGNRFGFCLLNSYGA